MFDPPISLLIRPTEHQAEDSTEVKPTNLKATSLRKRIQQLERAQDALTIAKNKIEELENIILVTAQENEHLLRTTKILEQETNVVKVLVHKLVPTITSLQRQVAASNLRTKLEQEQLNAHPEKHEKDI